MARVTDYDKKIELLKSKIETKNEQLKKLKEELKKVEVEAAKSQMTEIAAYIQEKNLNPGEVLNVIKERFQ